ncbi:GNAT family N-acetyltransferase [Actinoplanes sp. NPDC051411]|uniref:GNAT family N-acetyltransferase n=1 Tax=Actinoplanes sp. NPDC051411 TaxID=3155522 RepID=UPI00342DE439
MADVQLRMLQDEDLDPLFEMMRDPVAVKMAAFTPPDPDDRAAFDRRQARVRAWPEAENRAVTVDGRFVGTIASFLMEGDTEITYWIDRRWWGQGVASRAVSLFLSEVAVKRPLLARAASDNAGSLAVLRKAGFRELGRAVGFADAGKPRSRRPSSASNEEIPTARG